MLLRERAACGHRTRAKGKVQAFGVTTKTKMPRNKYGMFDCCHECLGKMAIKCAWCGLVIFIGDPITLYSPAAPWVMPKHAVVYSDEPLQVVGCLRWDCAESGADRAGFWLPHPEGKGHVQRVPTAYELILGGARGVSVSDLSDRQEVPTIFSPN